MTTRVIYHNFKNRKAAASRMALTAPMLLNGRRLIKTTRTIPAALNAVCIFLCGGCTMVSLFILVLVSILW